MKRIDENRRDRFRFSQLNSVLAYAAALMLSGIPPAVCETVLDEFYGAVRKSIGRIKA